MLRRILVVSCLVTVTVNLASPGRALAGLMPGTQISPIFQNHTLVIEENLDESLKTVTFDNVNVAINGNAFILPAFLVGGTLSVFDGGQEGGNTSLSDSLTFTPLLIQQQTNVSFTSYGSVDGSPAESEVGSVTSSIPILGASTTFITINSPAEPPAVAGAPEVDNVVIQAAPEPSMVIGAGTGTLFGLAYLWRSRRVRA